MTIPVWVYFAVMGIVVSAFMTVKTTKEERDLEMKNIEREGEVFMKRLEEEKENRKSSQRSLGV